MNRVRGFGGRCTRILGHGWDAEACMGHLWWPNWNGIPYWKAFEIMRSAGRCTTCEADLIRRGVL